MRLRFITSIPDFVEGREIEIEPHAAQALEWLRAGVAVPVRDLAQETTLAPDQVEQAVVRRTRKAGRGRRTHSLEGD